VDEWLFKTHGASCRGLIEKNISINPGRYVALKPFKVKDVFLCGDND
jgi:hypothetical protein